MAKRRKKDKDYYARWGRLDPRYSVLTPEEAGSSVEAWRDFARAKTYPYLPYDPRNPATWMSRTFGENPRFESIVDPISNKVVGSDKPLTPAQKDRKEQRAIADKKTARKKEEREATKAERERRPSFYDPGNVPEWRRDVFPLDKPLTPEQFRAGEGTSPTTAPSAFNLERIMEDRGLSDLRRHFGEGAYGGHPTTISSLARGGTLDDPRLEGNFFDLPGSSRADQFMRPGINWQYGGQIDDTLLPVDPMGINPSTGLPSAGIYRAPDEYILSDELSAKAEDEMMFARDAREEAAAALTTPEVVAPVNTVDTSPVEFDVNLEGLIDPDAPPRAVGVGIIDASLNTKEFKELTSGGNDFMSRLARFNEIAPQFSGISREVLSNRKRLQRRNDVLRAFQRMGPKDIVWSDNMTTAQMVAKYKRDQDAFFGRALAATNPQRIEDVNLLARKLGAGMDDWGEMIDLFKKGRPDYEYSLKELEHQGKLTDLEAESRVGRWFEAINNMTSNLQERDAAVASLLKRKLHPKVRAAIIARHKSYTEAFKEQAIVQYDLPWGWKDNDGNKEMLKELGLSYVVKDPANKREQSLSPFGDNNKWLFVDPMQAAGFNLNLQEPKKRMLRDALLSNRSYHTGIAESETSAGQPHYALIGPKGIEIKGMRFAWNNNTAKSYANYLKKHYGIRFAGEDEIKGLRSSAHSQKTDKELLAAKAVETHADRVNKIAGTVLALDDAERAKIDPKTGKPSGRSIFGGVAGLQLAIENYVQLADNIVEFASDAPAGAASDFVPGSDPRQAGARFNRWMASDAMQKINDTLDELNDPNRFQYEDAQGKEVKRDLMADLHNLKAELNTMLTTSAGQRSFQQNAIYADMLSISLATMAARMLSRKDRLLKDQYVIWKERLNIHKWNKSAERARAQIEALREFAQTSVRYSQETIRRLTPDDPTYKAGSSGGITRFSPIPLTDDERNNLLRKVE